MFRGPQHPLNGLLLFEPRQRGHHFQAKVLGRYKQSRSFRRDSCPMQRSVACTGSRRNRCLGLNITWKWLAIESYLGLLTRDDFTGTLHSHRAEADFLLMPAQGSPAEPADMDEQDPEQGDDKNDQDPEQGEGGDLHGHQPQQ